MDVQILGQVVDIKILQFYYYNSYNTNFSIFYRIIQVMASLTKQKLFNTLKQNKTYKQCQPFLDAFSEGNEKVLPVINKVFLEILASQKIQLMSKLLVLRMYKDLFITGNITMFDMLDPEIEEFIVEAAEYNSQFRAKDKNDKETRGGMYFVQKEKRTKSSTTLQLGNSFVLLATEIIGHFAEWFPRYPNKKPSKFLQLYQELEQIGVQFNSSIYFQPQEQQKFQINYKKWLEAQFKNVENKQQNFNDVSEDLLKQKMGIIFEQQETINKLKQQIQNLNKNNTLLKQQLDKQLGSKQQGMFILSNEKQQYQQKLKVYDEKMLNLEKQIKQLCKQNEEINIQKNELVMTVQKLTGENAKLQQVNNKLIQQIDDIKEKLSKQKVKDTEKNKQCQKCHNFEILKTNLIQERQKNKGLEKNIQEIKNKYSTFRKQIEDYLKQMEVAKKEKEEMQQTIEKLKIELQKANKYTPVQFKKQVQKKLSAQKIDAVKEDDGSQYNYTSVNYNQISTSLKDVGQQHFKAREQPTLSLNGMLETKCHQQTDKQKNYSPSLASVTENFYKTANTFNATLLQRKNSNSIIKTENSRSKLRERQMKQSRGLLQNSSTINAFYRTENVLVKKNINLKNSPKISLTSVFPFIQQYFNPINIAESAQFRACCLSQEARRTPFFNDQMIELRLFKSSNFQNSSKMYSISVKNRLNTPISIQIQSQTPEIKIRDGNNYNCIQKYGEISFKLDAHIVNLNFRYPIVNILVIQGRNENKYKIPLPITLFSFVEICQSGRKFQKFGSSSQNGWKKHRSQKVFLNKVIKTLPLAFQQLIFEGKENGCLEAKTCLSYPQISQIQMKLTLLQTQQTCQFETQFLSQSKISQSFSKVILQVLMFMVI